VEDGYVVAAGKATSLKAESDLLSIAAVRVESPAPFAVTNLMLSTTSADAKAPNVRIGRVELPGKQRYLHLAEVQVFSRGENVALKGTAKQSSTDFGGDAKRAIDGNTNGDYNANSVCHTGLEDNPWWEVNLGQEMPVEKVVLWNRTDGGDGTAARMKGYRIVLYENGKKQIDERKSDGYPNPKAE